MHVLILIPPSPYMGQSELRYPYIKLDLEIRYELISNNFTKSFHEAGLDMPGPLLLGIYLFHIRLY